MAGAAPQIDAQRKSDNAPLRNAGQRRDLFTIDKRSLSGGRAKNGKQQGWHD